MGIDQEEEKRAITPESPGTLNYIAVYGNAPSGNIEADSMIAKTLFGHFNQIAEKHNVIRGPMDFQTFVGHDGKVETKQLGGIIELAVKGKII